MSKRRGRSNNRRKPEAVRTKALSVIRERAGRGVRPDPLEGIGDVLQQAYFIARKQRQKVFKAQGKTPKNRLAFIGDT